MFTIAFLIYNTYYAEILILLLLSLIYYIFMDIIINVKINVLCIKT